MGASAGQCALRYARKHWEQWRRGELTLMRPGTGLNVGPLAGPRTAVARPKMMTPAQRADEKKFYIGSGSFLSICFWPHILEATPR